MGRLIGRDADLAALMAQIGASAEDQPRVVTLTGLPGSGKSALAAAAARRLVDSGAFATSLVVGLRAAADPLSVVDAVLARLPAEGLSTSLPEAMWEAYDGAPVLVVLEDVDRVEGLGEVMQELARGYPDAAVLCTSLRPSHVRGERIVRLGALDVPDDAGADHPAVLLFAELARARGVDIDLDDESVHADVVRVCRAAGGLPGAIDFAAARLDDVPLSLMSRTLGDRQGAGSALGWSFDLLTKAGRRALVQLSVFEASFLLDAVGAVVDLGPTSEDPTDALFELVDANLLELDPAGAGEPRFVMSAPVRSFARTRLDDQERARVRDRHARYFSHRGKAGLDVVRQEWPDIVAALDHDLDTGRLDDALATAVALAPEVQEVPGAVASLDQRITELLERQEHVPPRLHARALMWSTLNHPDGASADVQRFGLWTAQRLAEATALARESGDGTALLDALERTVMLLRITLDLPAAVAAAHEGLELARRLDDEPALARFECFVGMAALSVGDAEQAVRLATSSLTRGREHDDPFAQVAAAQLLLSLPEELRPVLDPRLPTLEELLEQCERLDQPVTGMTVLASLAHESLARGDPAAAARWLWRLLMIAANRQRTEPMATLAAVVLLLSAALALDETDDAARLREYTRHLEMFVPYCVAPPALPRYQEDTAHLDATVSEPRRVQLAREVATLGVSGINRWAQELARRLAGHHPPSSTTVPAGTRTGPDVALTPREREVLAAMATGLTNRAIADELGMTAKTVMHHSMAIYRKLGVRGRAGATAWAFRHGATERG